ncbi:MAG: N-acetylmuramoyl-L-alanine amidase, partial [Terrisporobacter sp.]
YLVACDDGHGMETPGKRTPSLKEDIKFRGKVYKKGSCIHENEFNKNIMEIFIKGCKRCGIGTLQVSQGDTDIPLATRVSKANSNGTDLYVSFHANALTGKWQTSAHGLVVIVHEICQEKTKILAKNIYDSLKNGVDWYSNGGTKYGVRKDTDISGYSLYVLKNTKMPAVLVEYGFMDNWEDVKRMCTDKFAQDCAENTLKGVCKTLGIKYIEGTVDQPKPNVPSPDNKDIVYRVIAGSYSNKGNAENLVKELKNKGYDAFVSPYSV